MVVRRELLAGTLQKLGRACTLASAAFSGLWEHRKLPRDPSRMQCARWLHERCGRALRALNVQISIEGELPSGGLIVSNHLSYLDIPVLSAALPCVFVSKAEVEDWPIFGRYARWAGSVFVRRHDRADAARANTNVGDALRNGVPVVLFPEGTTTNGERVLRFHSTMLQPAIDAEASITPCAISYELDEGNPAREVAWWGDMTLLPHIWNLLAKKTVRARVSFGDTVAATGDRKELSSALHDEVVRLHDHIPQTTPA